MNLTLILNIGDTAIFIPMLWNLYHLNNLDKMEAVLF
jgi:hypothetical protein